MDNPHLTGFDADKREYSVSRRSRHPGADQPRRRAARGDHARRSRSQGQGTATITAEAGDYDNKESTLKLLWRHCRRFLAKAMRCG